MKNRIGHPRDDNGDYEAVHALWMSIHGFGIRSIDDSREGVERFL